MNESAFRRHKAIEALKDALDANVVLTQVRLPGRFDEVKKRRDQAIEEAVDEWLLAAEAGR